MLVLALGFLAWQGYMKYGSRRAASAEPEEVVQEVRGVVSRGRALDATSSSRFKCDGRTYCSQMTSCAEATFFVQNCPGVKMDGDHDGVPCERQWCN